ncbi:MAG: flagellar protein FliT [Nitrosomonadales bacterium]|nr:flagellar protein FliT [Nitrosomonadales bacterium]
MDQVIESYESLASIMGKMREAAAQGEWDRLVELEKQCGLRVEAMKARNEAAAPDENTRLRKVALIRKILADDAEIRNYTEPWMAQLQRILRSAGQERRLQRAYSGE